LDWCIAWRFASFTAHKMAMDENVLVVPTQLIETQLQTRFDRAPAEKVIAKANELRNFLPRSQVEQDETVKQIIPYICIRHGDEFVLLQRTKRQSEARLHNKFSLGIGGHINEQEVAGGAKDLVQAGLLRELSEEITVAQGWKLNLLGTIYDSSTPVGRVHFGIVYELVTPERSFTLNEPDLMSGQWVSRAELGAYKDRMETWSQLLMEGHIERRP
jgi:predicted NUDIX family phosphoesterase